MSQMVIQVNKEGGEAVAALADIALKVGGLSNLQKVNQILSCVKMVEEAPAEGPKIVQLPKKAVVTNVDGNIVAKGGPLDDRTWSTKEPAEEQ